MEPETGESTLYRRGARFYTRTEQWLELARLNVNSSDGRFPRSSSSQTVFSAPACRAVRARSADTKRRRQPVSWTSSPVGTLIEGASARRELSIRTNVTAHHAWNPFASCLRWSLEAPRASQLLLGLGGA
jgi:hypothetical protein